MVSLECRAAGTAAAADASALRELLQGLSGLPPARVYQHELVLKGPGQERQAVELRLTHHLPLPPTETAKKQWQRDCSDGWEVRHEGAAQRGKGMAELPVAVRTVAVSHCVGEHVPGFWQALGFRTDFELLRDGHAYAVLHGGIEVQVTVSRIFRLEAPGDVSNVTEVDPDRVLVEAAHAAAEGQQLAVGEAVRSLSALLVPLVELQRF